MLSVVYITYTLQELMGIIFRAVPEAVNLVTTTIIHKDHTKKFKEITLLTKA